MVRKMSIRRKRDGGIMPFEIGRGRRYPIKRDDEGRSARQRAFALFDAGLMPAEVAAKVGVSARTARRYRSDWRKRPTDYHFKCVLIRQSLRHPSVRDLFATEIASRLDLPVRFVMRRLSQPWAVKQIVTGEWVNWGGEEREKRRWARLQAAGAVLDMCAEAKVSPSQVIALLQLLKAKRRAHGRTPQDSVEQGGTAPD